ncbi:A24 family peptidase [Ruminococcaceae bacterium OttesenSCG-928-L11]|nr:A24 family peptidase [Ruminococcaceae bacterium OttesenSCG-928-L11]
MNLAITLVFLVGGILCLVAGLRRAEWETDGWRTVFAGLHPVNLAVYIAVPVCLLGLWALHGDHLAPLALCRAHLVLLTGLAACISDIRENRIPNTLILVMLAGWAVTTLPEFFIDVQGAIVELLAAFLGFVAGGAIFLLVYVISKKGLGGGDVKLMAAMGLYVTVRNVFPVMLSGCILAAATGLVLILTGKLNRKDPMPLAPFLYAGLLLTLAFNL